MGARTHAGSERGRAEARQDRLKAALRANLKKRKAQARVRKDGGKGRAEQWTP